MSFDLFLGLEILTFLLGLFVGLALSAERRRIDRMMELPDEQLSCPYIPPDLDQEYAREFATRRRTDLWL